MALPAIWSAGDSSCNCSGRGAWSCRRAASASQPGARRATHGEKALAPLLLDTTSLEAPLRALRPLEFEQVRAHARRAALQLPRRPVSSPRLHAAGGGTRQISGLAGGRVIACLAWSSARGIWAPAIALSLVGRGAAPAISVFSPTILAISFCLGFASAFGVARSWSDGTQNRGGLGTGSTGTPSIFSRPSSIPNATAARVIGRRTGW